MVKICVSSSGANLDAMVDPRFGRCTAFLVVDSDSMEFEAVSNQGVNAASGAGIQAAQTVVNKGAEVVITGSVGPNAHGALSASGIKIFTVPSGTVREAIQAYKENKLSEITTPGPAHRGMGRGRGRGRGGGRGGGR